MFDDRMVRKYFDPKDRRKQENGENYIMEIP
jgi:hypothetical protein